MSNETTRKPAPSTKKEIVIAPEKVSCPLGGPVPLVVRYVNRTNGTLSFREPAKTWEVKLLVGRPGAGPAEVPFGRIFVYKSGDLERRTIEDAETIVLQPGGVHEFKYDVGRRWPELFVPGVNLVGIKDESDDAETVFSNKIEVRAAYDKSTFPLLLAIVADEQSTVDSCRFAAYWISRLYPGFEIATGAVTDEQRNENRKRIDLARAWWDAHGKDAETVKRIENLNREVGAAGR